jgi:hypothetical protein
MERKNFVGGGVVHAVGFRVQLGLQPVYIVAEVSDLGVGVELVRFVICTRVESYRLPQLPMSQLSLQQL